MSVKGGAGVGVTREGESQEEQMAAWEQSEHGKMWAEDFKESNLLKLAADSASAVGAGQQAKSQSTRGQATKRRAPALSPLGMARKEARHARKQAL